MLSVRNGIESYYVVMPIVAIRNNKKDSNTPNRKNKDAKKNSDFKPVFAEVLKSESSKSLFDSKI